MCSINHEKKAIFIHIPKNGGSYIADILSKNYGFKNYYLHRPDHKLFCLGKDNSVDKHENKIHGTLIYYKTSSYINQIMGMNENKWNNYYIFSFIRNPYDRIVSGWNYCNKNNISFNNYIHLENKVNSYDYWHIFMSQSRHLIGNKGKININYIGKFENLENDLKIILNNIGINYNNHISFKKNSKKHNNYKTYYNNEILEQINIILKEDLENFDYKIISDIKDFD
jgi:hypothetical protein